MLGIRIDQGPLGTATRAARLGLAAGLAAFAWLLIGTGAHAETIGGALAKAYLNNPDINQQRAAVRASDENIPKANAGYLPTISGEANAGIQSEELSHAGPESGYFLSHPRGYGLTASENLFNGNKTLNSVRQAESQVLGARETLRNTEQNVLLSALTDYMDVLRDTAILALDHSNVEVLQEQLRQTRDRFNV